MASQIEQVTTDVVTPEDWESRKAFVGFTDEDAKLLEELRPVAEDHVDEMIEELYERVLQTEETQAFFSDSTDIERVKTLQKKYFLRLTRGPYDETYLTDRLRVGRIHHQVGLPPRWYMGAYSIYLQLCFSLVLRTFRTDEEKTNRVLMALTKLVTLDEELAITTYISARETIIEEQVKEILELERIQLLTQTAGAAAHEINQPLTVLMGMIEITQHNAVSEERRLEILETMYEEAQKIKKIVAQMNSIRRVVTKPYANKSTIVDLEAAAQIPSNTDSL